MKFFPLPISCITGFHKSLKNLLKLFEHRGKLLMFGGPLFSRNFVDLYEAELEGFLKCMNVDPSEIEIGEQVGQGTFRKT